MTDDKDYKLLESVIGYTFQNKAILKQALTHNSYINENELDFKDSNERLEFLGDALLDSVIAEMLYNMYPDYNEGELTVAKSNLVSRKCLGEIGLGISLGEFLLVGKGIKSKKDNNFSVLSCAVEALFAAVYLDGGEASLKKTVSYLMGDKIADTALVNKENYKGQLQQITQEREGVTPVYRMLEAIGPDHNKEFVSGVFIEDKLLAKGYGSSKKKAELDAAKKALDNC